MPFASAFDDTYLVAIQPAALAVNALAERVDHNGVPGEVLPQIKKMIEASEVVIADLSGTRPDVCYEVGFAEALKRPIIQICRTPIQKLPFSLRNNQTIHYAIGQTTKLREKLEKELRKLIA